ncbi:hypothetical protein P7K49_013479 [Saguinus oedipus]|uniref:Uncharacterized protein n=1 Tax=Saguinus oedipus TaxID=9490 RepID=A0ABQ9VG18_SAGOE|nr:hypothetical protein P7K49_013479 [Saguinus oedipus]
MLFLLHKNGRKNATTPGKKVGEEKSLAPVFAEKLISPGRRGAKLKDHESHQEIEDRNSELDQDEEGGTNKAGTKGRKDLPTRAEDDENDDDSGCDKGTEEEEEEEPIKETPDKPRKEMANQKGSPGTKNQKLEGNLLAVEKALELRDTKVLGYEIKFKKPKGKKTKVCKQGNLFKDQNARTLLIKNVPDRATQHELKEVFEDAFQIRLVSKDGLQTPTAQRPPRHSSTPQPLSPLLPAPLLTRHHDDHFLLAGVPELSPGLRGHHQLPDNLELYASCVYLSMSYYFDRDDVALKNFARYSSPVS